ncbi:CAP domain-containing protein [Peribacillus sp. SCS-37]|uniref:CAP domain-containing protein n=1 Tax=Paraperibacillus esterisolvens TaxID=3115296 RepID=UPI003906BC65
MKRILILIILVSFSWILLKDSQDLPSGLQDIKAKLTSLREDENLAKKIEETASGLGDLAQKLKQSVEEIPEKKDQFETKLLDKPALSAPKNQVFSIYNIELGDTRSEIEKRLGKPKRETYNEYGLKWSAYHQDYQRFTMVSYDENNKAAGLYTNQDLITSTKGIEYGSNKAEAARKLGKPLDRIQKGLISYLIPKERDYDTYLLGGTYTTIFYDKHQENTVTAIQIIRKDIEQHKRTFYARPDKGLEAGFEYQLFDLVNASRLVHGLGPLTWDAHIKQTAQKHSADMAVHHYFDHTNLQGLSPFDRMKEDNIRYRTAGENIAYGQLSSVYAHEGLMNSLGHRENILKQDYERLGVGVAFNEESQPYYTQNFFTE